MQAVTGPGRVIAARYELLDRIGQGAMGTVWRARDLVLTREVAIKEVRLPDLMPDEDRKVLRERTLREARVSAKLSHPGVVTVYDVIEACGTPWIVMELVAARSLEQVLAADGPLPPRQVAGIGAMLLGALASAHAAGIVHRDVKPGNVLITGDGRAVLTDFGIATLDGEPGLTQAGMVMGTPGFCAPERIRGAPASPASDLWSLGATLYAAVTGRGPFEGHGSPMAVLASIVHSDPPPLPAAGQLGTVIASLMSKDPAQRPDTACAIGLLTDVAAGNPGNALALSPYPGGTRPATVISAADRTDPAGFPAADAPGGTVQFPAGTGPDSGPPGPAVIPAGAAATPGWPAGPFPATMEKAPFPDGVGDVQFPVSAGAAVPPWALPGRSGTPAGPGPAGAPARLGQPSARGGQLGAPASSGSLAALALASPQPVDTAVASPVVASPAAASPAAAASVTASPAAAGPVAAGPALPGTGEQAPLHQPGTAGLRGTLPRRPPRSTGSRVLMLSLAGAAIVLVGLVAGVLLVRALGHGKPGTSGSGGSTAAGTLPAGYYWYRQASAPGTAAGFAMAVPNGWQGSRQGAVTNVRDALTGGTITASFAPFIVPGPVREARALELAAVSRGTYPGYRRIAITPLLLHGRLAGAWRFSYRQPGTGLIEGLDVVSGLPAAGGPQPYELQVTAPVANWPASRAAFAEALRTLRAGQ